MYVSLAIYDTNIKKIIYVSHDDPQLCKVAHKSIAEDKNGNVWSATSKGLFIIDAKELYYRHLSVKDGLPDMYLYSISFDNSGNAWIGTHDDVTRIDPSRQVSAYKIGGNIDDFGFSCTTINDERVILSGNKGIAIFLPSRLTDTHVPCKPHISGIFIDGTRITKNSAGGICPLPTESTSAMTTAILPSGLPLTTSCVAAAAPISGACPECMIPGLSFLPA